MLVFFAHPTLLPPPPVSVNSSVGCPLGVTQIARDSIHKDVANIMNMVDVLINSRSIITNVDVVLMLKYITVMM